MKQQVIKRPGGELAARPLHFIWIADCSGSMGQDGKIQALNNAIREAVPHMQKVASENPNAKVLVRAAAFSSGAKWHIGEPVPVEEFQWKDLSARGVTDLGEALTLVADALKIPPMTERALPPVLVLISDGKPTDEYQRELNALMQLPWGVKSVRMSIAIGEDADTGVLQEFMGHDDFPPLQANNPESLVRHIRWVSTAVLQSASSPAGSAGAGARPGQSIPVPEPVTITGPVTVKDVW